MTLDLADPVELATVAGPAAGLLVVVDFDGTLSPIVPTPGVARPAEGALDALARLMRQTTVAIVSGRTADDVADRVDGLGLWIVGGHGAELRHPDGTLEDLVDTAQVTGTLDDVESVVRALVEDRPGWLVERKATSVAVHHRLAPPEDVDEFLPRVRASLEAVRDEPPGYSVLVGKAVEELRPSTVDKGRATALLLERSTGLRPLVVGDDVTDEDAFRVADERNGIAVLVAEHDRPTGAGFRLADPDAVVRFLMALADSKD